MVIRVRVDSARCQGHTLCNLAAPTVFSLRDEDGHGLGQDDLRATLRDLGFTIVFETYRNGNWEIYRVDADLLRDLLPDAGHLLHMPSPNDLL